MHSHTTEGKSVLGPCIGYEARDEDHFKETELKAFYAQFRRRRFDVFGRVVDSEAVAG